MVLGKKERKAPEWCSKRRGRLHHEGTVKEGEACTRVVQGMQVKKAPEM